MGGREALEAAKTVMEVADVAWTAMECHHHLRHHNRDKPNDLATDDAKSSLDEDLESLQSENHRLRNLLEKNLQLLHKLVESPSFVKDCPPDVFPNSLLCRAYE